MFRRLLTLFSVAALGSLAVPVHAQEQQTDYGAPAHVAFVDGTATLEREGRTETSALNMPLLSGDRLRTTEGRVEVLFEDGSALHLDERTTIDVQSDDLLRLIDGRIRLNLVGPSRQVDYRIDSSAGSVRITQAGEYRIAMVHGERETQLELAVLRGAGEIFTDQGSTPVSAGERAYASEGLAPSYPYVFNSANWDAFDRWSEMRRDVRLGVSSQYLPASMQTYAPVFDQYGDWRYAQPYGYVWYPRVAVGWRPYYYGRWMSYPRYGWTWVGLDFFSWPTHHYGRWGFSAGTWFWIPGNRWAPAYVSWAYAPGFVSWCPLGFNNRPVIAINLNFGSRFYSPWNAWTVVTAGHFGGGFVHHRPVFIDRFDARHRPVFVSRPAAPAYRDVAIPRGSAPIRWAGARANGDNYFTRGGDRGEHIVAPAAPSASRNAWPAPSRVEGRAPSRVEGPRPSRQPRDLATERVGGSRNATAAEQRAVPRGTPAPGSGYGIRGGTPTQETPGRMTGQRTAPDGPMRRIEPRGGDNAVYAPRERIGRDSRQPYSAPSAPVTQDPRVAAPYYDRRPMGREPAPGTVTPRETAPMRPVDRGEMAVPRGMPPQPRSDGGYQRPSYGGQSAPRRVAPPPQAAPAPPPQRSAPAERSRPSGSQSTGQATSRRGGGRGGN
jgi:hypothetical protein